MDLQERLDAMKEKSRERLPDEILAAMKSNLDRLRASGRENEALGVGAAIPEFALQKGSGRVFSSKGLLDNGPLVINFFRGHW